MKILLRAALRERCSDADGIIFSSAFAVFAASFIWDEYRIKQIRPFVTNT